MLHAFQELQVELTQVCPVEWTPMGGEGALGVLGDFCLLIQFT